MDEQKMTTMNGGVLNSLISIVRFNGPVRRLSKPELGGRTITLDQVSWHDKPSDCWVIIYDRIYDITEFLDEHPGGADLLLEHAGRDASAAFRSSGHSEQAMAMLARFFIGELPLEERIFRKPGGYALSDIPK